MLRTALRFVEQIARDGSMRKAAENLHIASSAINRQLLKLEEELNVKLFERMPRGVRPTAAGEIMLAYIRRWQNETLTLHSQLDDLQHGAGGTVRVVTTESVVEALLPPMIARVRERLPRISFIVDTGDSNWMIKELLAKEADVGIAFNVPGTRGIRVVGSRQFRIGVVMAPGHSLAGRSSLTLSDCEAYPLILPTDAWLGQSVLRDAFSLWPARLNVVARGGRSSVVRSLARSGLGLAFLSPMEVAYEVQHQLLKYVPLDDARVPEGRLSLLAPSRPSTSNHATLALEMLRQGILASDN